ncbi:MAG: hypothetical protein DCF15_08400 [Phormidesmis priestleyi]|uniref:DUF11 domain-containing protein n=1 Tax=Phormidesmis priestleyi TaxID=268141 RepID=A0A2W4ZD62_9CYAN|nr:MAG: hypothetical protein DCF15_08400 [Phormidesmis priestleyi]
MGFNASRSGTATWSSGVQVQNDSIVGDYLFLQPNNTANYLSSSNKVTYVFSFPQRLTSFSMIGSGLNNDDGTTIIASYQGVPIQITAANFSNLSPGMTLKDADGDGQRDTVVSSNTTGGVSVNTNTYNLNITGPIDTIRVVSGKDSASLGTVTIGLRTFEYCTQGATSNVIDYGDAPDSYGTTNANNGARHNIVSGLHLGTAPDSESDAVLPLDGTGDGADEDGITLPTLTAGNTSYTIPASNITATGSGTLHGWVDFDKNGTFSASEYASVAVTNGTPSGNLVWNSITAGAAGNTYARFRFTTDASINASRPSGIAGNGEVEDYRLAIASPPSASQPFTCDTSLYIVIGAEFNPFSQLSRINRSVEPFTFDPIGPQINNYNYNALAYNPVDNYLYGIVEFTQSGSPFLPGTVLKIGTDGVPVSLGIPQGYAIPYRPNAGTFLADGTYVIGRQTNSIVTLNVTTSPPTATNRGTVTGALFDDIAVNPYDTTPNRVYGVDANSNRLVHFNLANTGAGVTAVGGNTNFSHNYGSQFYDVFGNLLYRSGGINELYTIAADGSSTKIANTPSGGSHDGASCFSVGLSKEVNNSQPVAAGQTVTYTYRIANSSSLAMSVTLSDDLRSVSDYAGTAAENESSTPINGTYTGTVSTPSGTVTLSNSNQTITISGIALPPRSITPITVEVTVPSSATLDTYYNQATLTGLPPNFVPLVQSDYPATALYEDPTPLAVMPAVANVPNVLLAKRITAINRGLFDEQLFNTLGSESYVNVGTNADDDNAVNWPGAATTANTGSSTGQPVESYIAGIAGINDSTAVENKTIRPGDQIEYTIPFLSNGNAIARGLLICDRIPANTTFLSTAFNSSTPAAAGSGDRGIFISFNGLNVALTNVNDGDEIAATGGNDNGIGGYYFAPGIDPSSAFAGKTVSCGGPNTNGAIVVDSSDVPNATGDGVPNNSYGFIRFRTVIN